MVTIIIVILWLSSGAFSFGYWWAKDYDLTCDEIPFLVFASMLGPPSWVAGWFIHGNHRHFKVNCILWKKRG